MDGLTFELPVGLSLNGDTHKNVELLETNGVAEKVFVKKLSEKPFTWQGNVVAIAVKSIGDIAIGSDCRKQYLSEGTVTIPLAVKKLTMADVNTLMVEIHRRCWTAQIPEQEVLCRYCGKTLKADFDLDKIVFLPETLEKMKDVTDYSKIVVNLKKGFKPAVFPGLTDKEQYRGITDVKFNRITFRPPLLEDAIRNEAYFADSVGFWRRVAMDCLVEITCVDATGVVVETLPEEFKVYYGLRIFNEYLQGVDLKAIRESLQEHLPTLPYAYYELCGCDEQRSIPMVMEASNFFSE